MFRNYMWCQGGKFHYLKAQNGIQNSKFIKAKKSWEFAIMAEENLLTKQKVADRFADDRSDGSIRLGGAPMSEKMSLDSKILVLYTGGTIGMKNSPDGYK